MTQPDFVSYTDLLKTFERRFRTKAPWIRRDHVAAIFDAINQGNCVIGVPPVTRRERGFVFSAPLRSAEQAKALYERDLGRWGEYVNQHADAYAPFRKTMGDTDMAKELFLYKEACAAWRTFVMDPKASDEKKMIALDTPFVNPSAMIHYVKERQLQQAATPNILLFSTTNKGSVYLIDKAQLTYIRPTNEPVETAPKEEETPSDD